MMGFTLLAAVRVLHILSSTIWAGFIIVIGLGHTRTLPGQTPEAAHLFRRTVTRRAASIVPPAAVVSVLSGAYLFLKLHESMSASQEAVLGLGALFALLFFPLIAVVGRPAELKLAALEEAAVGGNAKNDAEAFRLNGRVLLAAYCAVVVMTLAVVAMAVARYL